MPKHPVKRGAEALPLRHRFAIAQKSFNIRRFLSRRFLTVEHLGGAPRRPKLPSLSRRRQHESYTLRRRDRRGRVPALATEAHSRNGRSWHVRFPGPNRPGGVVRNVDRNGDLDVSPKPRAFSKRRRSGRAITRLATGRVISLALIGLGQRTAQGGRESIPCCSLI
jgi:hypothetical protein